MRSHQIPDRPFLWAKKRAVSMFNKQLWCTKAAISFKQVNNMPMNYFNAREFTLQ